MSLATADPDFDVFLSLVELALANRAAAHSARRPFALASEVARADARADKLRARVVKLLGRRQHKAARIGGCVVGLAESERDGSARLYMTSDRPASTGLVPA